MQTVSKKDDFAVRWPNTVFARAFAVAIQRAHKDFKKTNITPLLSVLLFSTIECSVLMALVFYYKDMLEKVRMQRTQQFSALVCYHSRPQSLRSFWPAAGIERLWEQPFQACAIDADAQ